MSFLGNLIWFIFGGFWSWLLWFLYGILWCITIIGIPIGTQCFKFAKLSLFPFGKEVDTSGMGTFSTLLNIIWVIVTGIPMALNYAILGLAFCITIIGIPFGKQYFKLAKLALTPFGANVK